jgi:hypothetical protein
VPDLSVDERAARSRMGTLRLNPLTLMRARLNAARTGALEMGPAFPAGRTRVCQTSLRREIATYLLN